MSLDVLNCTMGDMKFSFDSNDPQEVERARRCVQDMLRRGYIIFIETKQGLRKVIGFNAKNDTYIIADGPMTIEEDDGKKTEAPKKTKAATKKRAISARGAKGTAIGPTAGG